MCKQVRDRSRYVIGKHTVSPIHLQTTEAETGLHAPGKFGVAAHVQHICADARGWHVVHGWQSLGSVDGDAER